MTDIIVEIAIWLVVVWLLWLLIPLVLKNKPSKTPPVDDTEKQKEKMTDEGGRD